MQLLLRNYLLSINEDSGEDAFAAFCKLHLQLSVRCTLQSELQKTGTRISEELAIYGILSMTRPRGGYSA